MSTSSNSQADRTPNANDAFKPTERTALRSPAHKLPDKRLFDTNEASVSHEPTQSVIRDGASAEISMLNGEKEPTFFEVQDMAALGLDLAEIRALVSAFREADPDDNGLDPEEFESVAGGFLHSKTKASIQDIFKLFDSDQSGVVTLREFICGYSILCRGSTEERIRFLFSMLDSSGKGFLTREDLKNGINLMNRYSVGVGARHSSDGAKLDSGRALSAVFPEYSLKDGRISFGDFVNLLHENSVLREWLDTLAYAAGNHLQTLREAKERELISLELERLGLLETGAPDATRTRSQPPSIRNRLKPGDGLKRESNGTTPSAQMKAHYKEVRRSTTTPTVPDAMTAALNSPFTIDFESLKLKSVIGRGASATVWRAEWLRMPVAVKIFEQGKETDSEYDSLVAQQRMSDYLREIEVLTQIRHPNILLYMALCVSPSLCIVTELYEGGTVFDFLHGKNPRRFSPKQALRMITNVAHAMVYLHSSEPQILHRDLKTSNILVDASLSHCVICDFGLSKVADSSRIQGVSGKGAAVGTAITMSPQVMQGQPYRASDDAYSFGIVAWEMFSGQMPFAGLKSIQLMFAVCNGERPSFNPEEVRWPPSLVSVLKQCWNPSPEFRPCFNEVLDALESRTLLDEVDECEKDWEENLRPASAAKYLSQDTSSSPPDLRTESSEKLRKRLTACNQVMVAVYSGDADDLKRVLEKYEEDGDEITSLKYMADYDQRTPLHIATSEGLVEITKILIAHGAPLHIQDRWGNTPAEDARRAGHVEIVKIIEDATKRETQ